MAKTIAEIIGSNEDMLKVFGDDLNANLRVAMPGIIQSFDSTTQTVSVQPALRERIKGVDLSRKWINFPLLIDVPIVMPRSGGYALTMPINKGDECLVVFADMCIDAWFSNGGVQNQIERRRHDLSDAFAILGTWSQPNRIGNYNTNSAQLINVKTGAGIAVTDTGVDIIGESIKLNGSTLNPSGASTYTYNQISPQTTWSITHNLNKYPSVSIVDSAGNLVVGDVSYISSNQVQVTFSAAFAGTAHLN